MYIDFKDIIKKFNLEIKGIVHIGGCKVRIIPILEIKKYSLVEAIRIDWYLKKKFFFIMFRMNLNIGVHSLLSR